MHGAIISGLRSLPGFSNNKKCSLQMRDWKEKTPTTKSRANQVGKKGLLSDVFVAKLCHRFNYKEDLEQDRSWCLGSNELGLIDVTNSIVLGGGGGRIAQR